MPAASAPRVLLVLVGCALFAGAAPAVQDDVAVLTALRSREAIRFAINAASRQMGAPIDGRWQDGEWYTARIPTHQKASAPGGEDLLAYIRVSFQGNPPDSVRATLRAVVWAAASTTDVERSAVGRALLADMVQRTNRILTVGGSSH